MRAGDPAAGRPFTVLCVCTGNICRSPAAELLLRAALDDPGVVVHSAGLAAMVGEPVAAPTARLLRARGLDPSAHQARQLAPAMLQETDLVLTMTVGQRAAVVRRVPAAVRRTFTLREFADLARRVPDLPGGGPVPAGGSAAARLAALTAAVPGARALRPAGAPDDIADPYGRPAADHAAAVDAAERAVLTLRDAMAALTSRSSAALG